MAWTSQNRQTVLERVIAAFCYMSAGLAGLIYIVLTGKNNQSLFFRFHFLQSILLGLFILIFNVLSGILVTMIGGVASLFGGEVGANVAGGTATVFALVSKAAWFLLLYGFIFSLLGKRANIFWVSKFIDRQL